MMNAKTGDWFLDNPQRARSNNSAIIIRGKTSYAEFETLINKTKEFGEPGFLYVVDEDQLLNPCFEISFIPITKDGRCGFQFCNLTSINGAKVKSLEDFKNASWAASLIGTLQAAYTSFPYLGHTSEELTEQEALLGVSITGMMDNPDILFNPEYQREAAKVCVNTNIEWAKKIGVNQASRVTCIKPEGTNSIVLSAASGIHPHHARKYFRRIQVNKEDNVYKFFKMFNEHACEESVWSANKVDDVITFPIEVDENVKIKSGLNAIEHLDLIKLTQTNWVNCGTTEANKKPLNHSVSCTVIVKDDEWKTVTEYLYKNQEYFTAVSLLPYSGDKIYQQAPMEAVITPEDEEKFNKLQAEWSQVDFTKLIEDEDETSHTQEAACAGGKCEPVSL
jgi:ribonucleoside-diphosphate reductase alpha chain